MKEQKKELKEYCSPQVMDYGNIKQLTMSLGNDGVRDNSSKHDTTHRTH